MAASGGAFDAFKAKVVAKLQQGKMLLKENREFSELVRSIGESKSKAEEDRIIIAEIEVLKQRLSDPKIDKSRGREYMIRLIYCEMLGHDTSFAHVKALQFASEPNILTKKAAYLALTQFFDHNNQLVLLLVNTLLSDLKSDNFINVITGLVVTTKLIGPDLINAVFPVVIDRLRHPKDHVRKKAVMVLQRFHQLDPKHDGPLSGVDLDKHFRTMLCDKDPSVMSAALCALHEVIKQDNKPYKNLIPSFTSILKQVSEHRLPKTYDYHRFPAPFIQIKLLKILAMLGAGDRVASENMYAVVQQTLRRANSSHTIGNAIIYECVRTITTIYPNPHLLAAAAEAISTFLKSSSHNLRYVGIDALAGIVKINPQYAQEHQLAVVDCLEDPDDTLKLKTLELLYKMTKSNNVEVISERMMGYLRVTTDEHIRRDIARKVSELAERYAPSPAWFIRIVSEVFELGGDHVEPALANSLMRLIAEQDTALHRSAVEIYTRLLDAEGSSRMPDVLLQVLVWVLGEYGSLAATLPGARALSPQQIQTKLVGLLSRQKPSEAVKALLLPALSKLCVQGNCALSPDAEAFVSKCSNSQNVELQQRAYELQALMTAPQAVQQAALPHDASCEEFDEAELSGLRDLQFLEWYVNESLRAGAMPYVPQEQRAPRTVNGDKGNLRFEAYEAAPSAHTRGYSGSSTPSAAAAAFSDPFADFGAASAAPSSSSAPHHARNLSNSSASGAPALTAVAQGPQLRGAQQGGGRWGPAQYDTRAPAPAPASSSTRPGAQSGGGDLLGAVHQSSGSGTHTQPASKPLTERDRLAASLFGGGSQPAAGRPPAPSASQAAKAPPPKPAPQPDLLDMLGSPPPTSYAQPPPAPAAQQRIDPMNLLMDFGSPVPAAAPAAPQLGGLMNFGLGPAGLGAAGGLGGLDLLGGLGVLPVSGTAGFVGGMTGGFHGGAPGGFSGAVPGGLPGGGAGLPGGYGLGAAAQGAGGLGGMAGGHGQQQQWMGGQGQGYGQQPMAAAPAKPAAAVDPFADLI